MQPNMKELGNINVLLKVMSENENTLLRLLIVVPITFKKTQTALMFMVA